MAEPFAEHAAPRQNVYRLAKGESLLAQLVSLRQRLLPRQKLVVGPYTGEFGYELQFRGYVQARRRHYKSVYVITYPGNDCLYPGCNVVHHPIDLAEAGYGYGRYSPAEHAILAQGLLPAGVWHVCDHLTTGMVPAKFLGKPIWTPEYEVLTGTSTMGPKVDILFHFRSVTKTGWDRRPNFEGLRADELVRRFLFLGFNCGCIGHPRYAYASPMCVDLRTADLRQTIGWITAAKCVIGQQSGPTHLANHCGKPTMIWAEGTNRIIQGQKINVFVAPTIVATDRSFLPSIDELVACFHAHRPQLLGKE